MVLELLEKMGCFLKYREKGARWCMVQQKTLPISIQLIETPKIPVAEIQTKVHTHLALSTGGYCFFAKS